MGIRLENLVVKFGDFNAINNVTLQIPKGKLVSLLGPSGSGKSTTLFTISGIHKPFSGKIFFGDKDVTGLEPEELGIGLVFQNYALYPHMTVRENIMFPLKNLKWNKEEAEKIDYGIEVGDMLYHRTYGEGSVIEIDKDKIIIKFKDICRSFSLKVLMENNLVILIN